MGADVIITLGIAIQQGAVIWGGEIGPTCRLHTSYFLTQQVGGGVFVLPGGEKVLLYFVQESPGDYVPLDTIVKTLGISANVEEGSKPQVRGSHPIGALFFDQVLGAASSLWPVQI